MDNNFRPDEKLFRAVKNKPVFWNIKTNRVSSAIFKDSHGVSVNRSGDRTDVESVRAMKNKYAGYPRR